MMAEEIFRGQEKRFLDMQEHALNEEINRAVSLAEPVFTQTWPNISTLAAMDQVIDIFKFLCSHVQRLKNAGRPDTHTRITAILNDLTATRATVTKTVRMLNAADIKDTIENSKTQKEIFAIQKKAINERIAQGQNQSNQNKKVL